jgi:hypothetical protein
MWAPELCYGTHMGTNRRQFSSLCDLADAVGGTVRLSWTDEGWGLQVTVPPTQGDSSWRAAGALFPSIDELEMHALPLAEWVRELWAQRAGD